jgi:SAM-dependent methyltransferase
MLIWKTCRVCTSDVTVHIQDIFLQRQGISAAQYFCMTCRSFFHDSNFLENDEAHRNDRDWLIQHPDSDSLQLARKIVEVRGARYVFEAGCGVGDLLLALEASGASASGIDPNSAAVHVAIEKGADARVGYFSTLDTPVDAIFAIDVLEHLPEPRDFFRSLRESVVEGGLIIVRVPEGIENAWQYLRGADKARESVHPDPFGDNSVHITQFSNVGLRLMGESLGTTYAGLVIKNCHLFIRA